MSDTARSETAEPGARIAKDAIDPDLVKLQRPRPKVGVITAAGVVFLAVLFLLRINPDRKFSGSATDPQRVAVADVVAGNVATERYVAVDGEAEPLMSQGVRAAAAKGGLGLRVVPVRGTSAKLWLVLSGDGFEAPQLKGYVGRLRKLGDLPFARAANDYMSEHPQPVFAAASAVRAGLAAGQVATVTGETVAVHDTDRVAFDVVDPSSALIVATLDDKLATVAAWSEALVAAGITTHGTPLETNEVVRFEATGDVATLDAKLAKAELLAARVEPVTHHLDTTWAELRTSSPSGFLAHGQVIPDGELDLVGLYIPRGIPDGAYALITGETPADYWYMTPVTIVVGLIALLFAWALVRAIKRDLLPTAPPAA